MSNFTQSISNYDLIFFDLYNKIHKKSYKSKPGTIIFLTENELQVSTGKGSLSIIDIQLEGKKRMTIEKFLRGFNVELGDSLG